MRSIGLAPFVAVHFLALTTAAVNAQSLSIASVASSGQLGNADSWACNVSSNGRFVSFKSNASNLVSDDTNGFSDIFVRDLQTGLTTRVSVSSADAQANLDSRLGGISADGRFVGFSSHASNLVAGDTNGQEDVFVHDRQTATTTRVSVSSGAIEANASSNFGERVSLSTDGRYVAFDSAASNLVANDTNNTDDIFVHDRQTGITTRESLTSLGVEGNSASVNPSMTPDGRYVVFESDAFMLDVDVWPIQTQVYRRDRTLGLTKIMTETPVNPGYSGNGAAWSPDISADGNLVAFLSVADNHKTGDNNFGADVFVRNVSAGTTTCHSVSPADAVGNFASLLGTSISTDGRYVAFNSKATNLTPGTSGAGFQANFFRRDLQTNTTILLSRAPSGVAGNHTLSSNYSSDVSTNGQICVFVSNATNMVAGDTNAILDIYASIDGLEPYGLGTPGCSGAHTLSAVNLPKTGSTTFGLRTTNAPASSLGLCIAANAQDLTGSDPFGLGILLHVDLLLSTEVVSFDTTSDAAGLGSCTVAIPATPALIGTEWYAQTIWVWSSCSLPPFQLSSSPGLDFVILP